MDYNETAFYRALRRMENDLEYKRSKMQEALEDADMEFLTECEK